MPVNATKSTLSLRFEDLPLQYLQAKRYGLWAEILIFLPIFVEILLQNDHN
jgi:hypothetical protein